MHVQHDADASSCTLTVHVQHDDYAWCSSDPASIIIPDHRLSGPGSSKPPPSSKPSATTPGARAWETSDSLTIGCEGQGRTNETAQVTTGPLAKCGCGVVAPMPPTPRLRNLDFGSKMILLGSGRGSERRGAPVGSMLAEFQLKWSHGDPFRGQNHVFV